MKSKTQHKILFIPTYDYLSEDMVLSFIQYLDKYELIYLHHDEYSKLKMNKHIMKYTHHYETINTNIQTALRIPVVYKFMKLLVYNRKLKKQVLNKVKYYSPSIIITFSDLSISINGIKEYCRINDIPIIIMQPSFFDSKIQSLPFPEMIKSKLRKLLNPILDIYPRQQLWGNEVKESILFLWGSEYKKLYSDDKDIRIVGNPVYDHYLDNLMAKENREILKKELFQNNEDIVLICTEAFGGIISCAQTRMLYKFYDEIIRSNPTWNFIVKIHPRDDTERIKSHFKNNPPNIVFVSNEYNLKSLFGISSAQVSVASVTSLEAVIYSCPIILINPNNKMNVNSFFNNTIEYKASTVDQFNKCLAELGEKRNWEVFINRRRAFLRSYLNMPINSASTICDQICQIVESTNSND